MNYSEYPIFELTAEDFEKLVVQLLIADDKLRPFSREFWNTSGFDFIGTEYVEPGKSSSVAIEIKHRIGMQGADLKRFARTIANQSSVYDKYIYITSAPVKNSAQLIDAIAKEAGLHGRTIQVWGQAEVFALLDKHSDLANQYFGKAKKDLRLRKWGLTASIITVIIGLSGMIMQITDGRPKMNENSISQQLETVESSIAGIKALELSLNALKVELKDTAEQSDRIRRDYEAALKLKDVTAEQLEAFRQAVNKQSVLDVFLNYFFGFLLGICGSVIASIIYDAIKRRRALRG